MKLMNKIVIPALAAVFALSACGKGSDTTHNCPPVTTQAPTAEVTTLRNYIVNANIAATADARGFFYKIADTGSAEKPSSCSNITINYVGKLTNNTQFDAQNGISFDLSRLITGWQEGIPLIGRGGKITLYLPPSLAYGSAAQQGIPANSILVFYVELNDFN